MTPTPQPKWTLSPDGKEWVIRWFILTTKPFRETPCLPPDELKRKGEAA